MHFKFSDYWRGDSAERNRCDVFPVPCPLRRQGEHLIFLSSSQDIDSQPLVLFPSVLFPTAKNGGLKFMFLWVFRKLVVRDPSGFSYLVHRSGFWGCKWYDQAPNFMKHLNTSMGWGWGDVVEADRLFYSVQVQGDPSERIGRKLKIEPWGDLWGCRGQLCQRQSCYQGPWIKTLPLSTKDSR